MLESAMAHRSNARTPKASVFFSTHPFLRNPHVAGASLLTLIDDIASVLDDVALMTKVAAKKTAGVLGDDLALNAQQVSGVRAERELPVVWAVAKGSFKNKLILVPAALAISALAPWAVTPLLMLGGAFLCYEGVEKLAHKLTHSKTEEDTQHAEQMQALADPAVDIVAFEKDKIKGAIRTDFILSAEIITITLGTVATETLEKQLAVLAGIAILMTAGVYGLVAGVVKLDDAGLYLSKKNEDKLSGKIARAVGHAILRAAPYLMKGLSIVGTAAMFLVGGGILVHGLPAAGHFLTGLTESAGALPVIGGVSRVAGPMLINALVGILAGAAVLLGITAVRRIFQGTKAGT
jgi:predicted DNA repair protein MutK